MGAPEGVCELGIRYGRRSCATLNDFYQTFQHDPQVVEQWFRCTAAGLANRAAVQHIHALLEHPRLIGKTPNKIPRVIGALRSAQKPGELTTIDGLLPVPPTKSAN